MVYCVMVYIIILREISMGFSFLLTYSICHTTTIYIGNISKYFLHNDKQVLKFNTYGKS